MCEGRGTWEGESGDRASAPALPAFEVYLYRRAHAGSRRGEEGNTRGVTMIQHTMHKVTKLEPGNESRETLTKPLRGLHRAST